MRQPGILLGTSNLTLDCHSRGGVDLRSFLEIAQALSYCNPPSPFFSLVNFCFPFLSLTACSSVRPRKEIGRIGGHGGERRATTMGIMPVELQGRKGEGSCSQAGKVKMGMQVLSLFWQYSLLPFHPGLEALM